MRGMVVLVFVGCASSQRADPVPAAGEVDASAVLIEATNRADLPALQRLLQAPIGYGGLLFHDADCNERFAAAGTIDAADVPAFAKCLSTLHFVVSQHRRHELPETALLIYDPGIEVEVRFDDRGAHLGWIGFVARENAKDALPTIHPDVLAAHRLTGQPSASSWASRQVLNDKLDAELAAHDLVNIETWFKLCIDAQGHVSDLHARQVSTPASARLIADVLKTWTFRPFELDGNAIPVCSLVAFQYPRHHEELVPLPPPPDTPAAVVVGRNVLKRVAGDTQIAPDDEDRTALGHSGVTHLTAAVLYCIDETGTVTTEYLARSSGLPHYDARLAAAVKAWRFVPFLDDGKPLPVCSTVVFHYDQNNAKPVCVGRGNCIRR